MSEHSSPSRSRWFSLLYATRVQLHKGSTPILNLSFLFSLLVVMSAPWLAAIGLLASLALGYRFRISRNDPAFGGSLEEVLRNAAQDDPQP